jgi:hypothetical protein
VHDDALQRLMFPNERDELAFVKGPHLVEPTRERPASARRRWARARRSRRSCRGPAGCPDMKPMTLRPVASSTTCSKRSRMTCWKAMRWRMTSSP